MLVAAVLATVAVYLLTVATTAIAEIVVVALHFVIVPYPVDHKSGKRILMQNAF